MRMAATAFCYSSRSPSYCAKGNGSGFMQAGAMNARVTYPASVGQRLFLPPARR